MKKLLGGIKVFRQIDPVTEDALKRELAHIGIKCAVDCGRVITSEVVANKGIFKMVNGLLDLADEMNTEFLSEKVIIPAEMVKLEHKAEVVTSSETKKTEEQAVQAEQPTKSRVDDELETIIVPPTKVE